MSRNTYRSLQLDILFPVNQPNIDNDDPSQIVRKLLVFQRPNQILYYVRSYSLLLIDLFWLLGIIVYTENGDLYLYHNPMVHI